MGNKRYPTVLSIAGSDPSGGAGLQADIKTIQALGAYAMAIPTAVTIQNTQGVKAVHPLEATVVGAQLETVFEDIVPDVLKIGMLANRSIVEVVATVLKKYRHLSTKVVLDPVIVASSGKALLTSTGVEVLKEALLPYCDLITPNYQEAEVLSQHSLEMEDDLDVIGESLKEKGAKNVLVTGVRLQEEYYSDVLYQKDGKVNLWNNQIIESKNTHGTGCTLSSAIAAELAKGSSLQNAIDAAEHYVHMAIVAGKEYQLGKGYGPLNHFWNL